MSAEKDKGIAIWAKKAYSPDEMSFLLRVEALQDPTGKYARLLGSKLEFIGGLPSSARLRFDPVRFEVLVGSTKGEVNTG